MVLFEQPNVWTWSDDTNSVKAWPFNQSSGVFSEGCASWLQLSHTPVSVDAGADTGRRLRVGQRNLDIKQGRTNGVGACICSITSNFCVPTAASCTVTDAGCDPSRCQQQLTSDGRTMDGLGSRCKIVVVGDTQCGKTALLHVFAKDCYPEVGLHEDFHFWLKVGFLRLV